MFKRKVDKVLQSTAYFFKDALPNYAPRQLLSDGRRLREPTYLPDGGLDCMPSTPSGIGFPIMRV